MKLFTENRKWIRIVSYCFFISAIIGFVVFFLAPGVLEYILEMYEEEFGSVTVWNFDTALDIFLQNTYVAAVALFGGIILGIAPILIVIANGFLFGFIVAAVAGLHGVEGVNAFVLLLGGLVPHGILELPAVLFAAAMGLRLGTQWLSKEAGERPWSLLWTNILRSIRYFIVIVAILFIAAMIEVFVSGRIVDNL